MMSQEAEEVWAGIEQTYLQGYPPHKTWWVELGEGPAVRELEARRLIVPSVMGRGRFSLTRSGVDQILDSVPMSDDAGVLLAKIGDDYRTAGFPSIITTAWRCEQGDKTVSELIAREYVAFAAIGAHTYRLTDQGQRWVMDHAR